MKYPLDCCDMQPRDPYEEFDSNADLEKGLSGQLKMSSFDNEDHPNYPERKRYVTHEGKNQKED